MALRLEQMTDKRDGTRLAGFLVFNKVGKTIALGALGHFVIMAAQRYENDKDLVRKIEKITGQTVRSRQNA